jgi:hypothetical protein
MSRLYCDWLNDSGDVLLRTLACPPPPGDSSAPGFLTTPEPVDLGNVEPDQKIPFEFSVNNGTSGDVMLQSLIPSCGCTNVDDVAGTTIAARAALRIRGMLDTKDRRGPMTTHAVLSYRSGSESEVRNLLLTVRADVKSPFRVHPEPVILGRDQPSALLTIDSEELSLFTVSEILPSVSSITASLENSGLGAEGASNRPVRIRLSLKPGAMNDSFGLAPSRRQSVFVRFHQQVPGLHIPVEIRE